VNVFCVTWEVFNRVVLFCVMLFIRLANLVVSFILNTRNAKRLVASFVRGGSIVDKSFSELII